MLAAGEDPLAAGSIVLTIAARSWHRRTASTSPPRCAPLVDARSVLSRRRQRRERGQVLPRRPRSAASKSPLPSRFTLPSASMWVPGQLFRGVLRRLQQLFGLRIGAQLGA